MGSEYDFKVKFILIPNTEIADGIRIQ